MAKTKGLTPARPTDKQIEDWLGEKGVNTEASLYTEEERRRFSYDAIGDIVGPHRYGIPYLLKRTDIQVLFNLSKRSAQRFIKRYLIPMGAVVQVGSQYLIQPWGVYRLLNPNGRCAYCGEGGIGECDQMPKFSVLPVDKDAPDTVRLERFKALKRVPKYRRD